MMGRNALQVAVVTWWLQKHDPGRISVWNKMQDLASKSNCCDTSSRRCQGRESLGGAVMGDLGD